LPGPADLRRGEAGVRRVRRERGLSERVPRRADRPKVALRGKATPSPRLRRDPPSPRPATGVHALFPWASIEGALSPHPEASGREVARAERFDEGLGRGVRIPLAALDRAGGLVDRGPERGLGRLEQRLAQLHAHRLLEASRATRRACLRAGEPRAVLL